MTSEHTGGPMPYGVLAEFSDTDALLHAVETIRERGFRSIEAYTPHPVERVSHALGHKNRLPLIVFLGGLTGAICGFGLKYWVSVIDYPVHVAGKPLNSWPAFIVVTFEMTILFAALSAVLGMFALNKLPQPYHPVFNVPVFELASRNRYFVLIRSADPLFDLTKTSELLRGLTSLHVVEVPR